MDTDQRVVFIRKWLKRANQADDVFDCFFSAWIALVVAAQRLRTASGRHVDDDSDRNKVVDYFKANTALIIPLLEERENEMRQLARRKGSRYGSPIHDTGNYQLREAFRRLSRFYMDGEDLSEAERSATLASLVNKVWNNVFHGVKVYDDAEDQEVLTLVNPILLQIVETCERQADQTLSSSSRT